MLANEPDATIERLNPSAQRTLVTKDLDSAFPPATPWLQSLTAALQLHAPAKLTCSVNRFYKCYASTPLSPGTSRCCVRFDGMDKIRQYRLVPTHIADRWRCRAGVPIISRAAEIFRRLAQIGGQQTVVLDDHRPFGAGQFYSPRISGKNRSSGLKSSYRAVLEFQQRN